MDSMRKEIVQLDKDIKATWREGRTDLQQPCEQRLMELKKFLMEDEL
jgi:hypothetical protein